MRGIHIATGKLAKEEYEYDEELYEDMTIEELEALLEDQEINEKITKSMSVVM